MAEVTITPRENGPYLVRGPVKLVDAAGNVHEPKQETIALCRCGGSRTKPFCDGTHREIGFTAPSKVTPPEEK